MKRKHLVILIAALLIGTFTVPLLASNITRSNYEQVIQDEYRLDPMIPPNSLYGPGYFYVVDFFGNIERVVCDASNFQDRVKFGDTKSVSTLAVFDAQSDLVAKLLGEFGGRVAASSIKKISVVIEHPQLGTLDDAARAKLTGELTSNEFCRMALDRALEDGYCVSQGLQVLKATTSIVISGSGSAEGELKVDEKELNEIRTAVAEEVNTKFGFAVDQILSGENMYFGYKLHDKCLQKPDAGYSRSTPKTKWWHWIALKNWFNHGSAVTVSWVGDFTSEPNEEVQLSKAQ